MWKKLVDSGGSQTMYPMPEVYLGLVDFLDPLVNVWLTTLGLETSEPSIAGQGCPTCAQLNP